MEAKASFFTVPVEIGEGFGPELIRTVLFVKKGTTDLSDSAVAEFSATGKFGLGASSGAGGDGGTGDALPRGAEFNDQRGNGAYTLVDADAGKSVIVDGAPTIPAGLVAGFQGTIINTNVAAQVLTISGITGIGKDIAANISSGGTISYANTGTTDEYVIAGQMEA